MRVAATASLFTRRVFFCRLSPRPPSPNKVRRLPSIDPLLAQGLRDVVQREHEPPVGATRATAAATALARLRARALLLGVGAALAGPVGFWGFGVFEWRRAACERRVPGSGGFGCTQDGTRACGYTAAPAAPQTQLQGVVDDGRQEHLRGEPEQTDAGKGDLGRGVSRGEGRGKKKDG